MTLDIGDGRMDGVIRAHPLIPARCNQLLQNAACRIGPVQQAHLPTPESFACRRRIVDHAGSGNFILLFSDGEDNAGYTSLKEAVDICQRNNTTIYAFRPDPQLGFGSEGPKTLADLVSQTGGRVFNINDSDAEIDDDLRTIEADLRNQYRLIYRPEELKHDGSFHRIQLKPPDRVESVTIRSGYYAPIR